MTSGELLALFRDEINDAEAPYFHSSSALYVYMDEAQKNFCRWAEGIEDATELAEASLDPGDDWLPLDPRILRVRQVVDAATGLPYPVLSMEEATRRGVRFDGQRAPVRLFVAGMEKHKLRAWPTPTETVNVLLHTFRLPLASINDSGTQRLEIDEQHHTALLLWMKARAYGKDDTETSNRAKAEECEERFRAYCAKARIEQGRVRHTPTPVVYGGI